MCKIMRLKSISNKEYPPILYIYSYIFIVENLKYLKLRTTKWIPYNGST